MDLKGRVALVTGGARVGGVVAEALARRGAHVALSYRTSRRAAEETGGRLRAWGVRTLALRADLSKPPDVRRLIGHVAKGLGPLQILVNLASHYKPAPLASLLRSPEGFWEKQLAADLGIAYRLSLAVAPAMKKAGGGRIIHFSDWVAASGRPRYRGFIPYYAAKAGIKGLTEALALELAPEILVNAVAPGPILAPPGLSKKANDEVIKNTPLGRWGGPAEIAKAALFLIESDFVTGETLRVDGGRHLY